MRTGQRNFAAVALAAALVAAGAHSALALALEANYIGLFKGNWGGSGIVVNDAKP